MGEALVLNINFLLVLMSYQLYNPECESSYLGEEPFMKYVYIYTENDMRNTLSLHDSDLSTTVIAKIVKNLLYSASEFQTNSQEKIIIKKHFDYQIKSIKLLKENENNNSSTNIIKSVFWSFLHYPLNLLSTILNIPTSDLNAEDKSSLLIKKMNAVKNNNQIFSNRCIDLLCLLINNRR